MTFVMTPIAEHSLDRLQHPPLRLAVVQVRTTPMLAAENAGTVQEMLAELPDWTLIDRQAAAEAHLVFGPGGVSQKSGGQARTVWVLSTAQDSIRASVSENYVAVESTEYDTWQTMRAALSSLLAGVSENLAPPRATRLGVRYVNVLPTPAAASLPELQQLICEPLLAPLAALELPLRASVAELRLGDEADASRLLVLRHGLQPEGGYLLDFDAFVEFTAEELFNPDALAGLAQELHDRIESLFVWSLAPLALRRLGTGKALT